MMLRALSHPLAKIVDVLEEVRTLLGELRRCFEELDPQQVSPEDARVLLREACAVEQLGAALKYRFMPKALSAAPWREEGHRSAASWLAETTRTSVPEAVSSIQLAERLTRLPATAQALANGAISPTEARAVAAAAIADPTAEADLLAEAESMPVSTLCSVARQMANAAHDRDPGHRQKLRSRRFLRFWNDAEGMTRLSGGLPADEGMLLFSAVRSRAAHVFDEAIQAQVPQESQEAYDADALVALAIGDERQATFEGPRGGRARSAGVVYHVDLEAFQRGSLEKGERCEVPGVGPVPLDVVVNVLGEATAKLVITDGVDVRTVCHLGRTVPAHLDTALEARDQTCVVPGCNVSLCLEIDHWKIPYARGGPTALWNLARICRFHHRLKTYDGYVLSGGPGKWEWHPPE